MWKKILISVVVIVALLGGSGWWFVSLVDKSIINSNVQDTTPDQIVYLQHGVKQTRGRVLAVVTSAVEMGESGKKTGYELTELARAYYVFEANGFRVDIASTSGGAPNAILDDEDMAEFDYAFINDPAAQQKVTNTLNIDDVNPDDYDAVYFVGGKGAMFDFPDNKAIQKLVRWQMENDKVVGAVCHGPAALVNVTLNNGEHVLKGRQVSAFTNSEELFLIPDAEEVFPFLLEDKLKSQGAQFNAGTDYLEKVSIDDNLLTGQNPWSVWTLAEAMVARMGYEPLVRPISGEETSIAILLAYEEHDYTQALNVLHRAMNDRVPVNRNLLLMHGILGAMKFDLVKLVQLSRLASEEKRLRGA